jgi:plastocyanin
MKYKTFYAGAFAIAAMGILLTSISSNPLYAQQPTSNSTTAAGTTVEVGAGSNATLQYFQFSPQTVEINAGESVTWTSPSQFSDIHTVTFVLDQNVTSDAILPFAIPNQTNAADFELLPPFNAGEPLIMQTPVGEALVALNKLVWYPAVIDANDQATYLNGTADVQYTLDGTQKALNSGILLPAMPPMAEQSGNSIGTVMPTAAGPKGNATETATTEEQSSSLPFPPISSFTVTFEEPGTYPYFCAIHPWMGGQVVVTDAAGSPSANAQVQ